MVLIPRRGTTGTTGVRALETVRDIEIGQTKTIPNIVRDGFKIPGVSLSEEALRDVLVTLPERRARIVSQSIPPGTKVPRGMAVDLVLSDPGRLPGRIIRNGHVAVADRTLTELSEAFLADRTVLAAVARNETAATLSQDELAAIRAAAERNDVGVTEDDPSRSMEALFTTLRNTYAFTGGG